MKEETATAQKFDEIVEKIMASAVAPTVSQELANRQETAGPMKEEASMRFAVPTNQGKLCAHFGHCEAFALIDADPEGNILNEVYVTPPPHEPGLLPPWLAEQGVNCIIAGGMGSRAQQLFAQHGVQVVTGALAEDPKEAVDLYLKGTLQRGANTCDH